MQILSIGAYAEAPIWAEHRVAPLLFQELAAGHYGFQPSVAFINGKSKGVPLAGQEGKLAERLSSYGIEILRLAASESVEEPEANLSLSQNPEADCYLTLRLPLAPDQASSPALLEMIGRLAIDSHAQYLYAHDWQDWRRLRRERGGELLFLRSCARGAHWITYFSRDYAARLGGEDRLKTAPAHEVRSLPSGILLVATPDPVGLDQDPQRGQIQRLQDYLVSLVTPEDRP
jgi:hypothetical protein